MSNTPGFVRCAHVVELAAADEPVDNVAVPVADEVEYRVSAAVRDRLRKSQIYMYLRLVRRHHGRTAHSAPTDDTKADRTPATYPRPTSYSSQWSTAPGFRARVGQPPIDRPEAVAEHEVIFNKRRGVLMPEWSKRRVVTGHDEHGKAVIISDGVPEHLLTPASGAATFIAEHWVSGPHRDAEPADLSARTWDIDPPHGGSLLRLFEFKPDSEVEAAEGTGGYPMHKTESIDYIVVISGELTLELDDNVEVTLKQGECLVQRGTIHAWHNYGAEPVLAASVMIGTGDRGEA